jgi:tRNA threonylcarbamoyladenosine biosynthesis protein TsaE
MHLELASPTAEDTRAIGAALAPLLSPGDVIALTGELGAGKTTLVQGIAGALAYDGAVTSPTFTLVREYRTPTLPLVHADVYRLDRVQDALDLGLDETAEDGVLLIEWGDAVDALLPADRLVVELSVPGEDDARRIALRSEGTAWQTRWERLEQAVDGWREAA